MLDADGDVHVMDFGLAKREAGEITMTVDGKVLGTPAYMSPEQARGAAHAADRRSDIYSLGVILFELLTGERPFRGDYRMLLHQVLTEEPPSPRRLNGRVPRDLETICLKCLEKEPVKRFSTGRELQQELQRFFDGHSITSRPVSGLGRAWRWSRRNPVVAGLSAVLMVSLFIFLSVSSYLDHQREQVLFELKTKSRDLEQTLVQRQKEVFRRDMNLAFNAFSEGNRTIFEDTMKSLVKSDHPNMRDGFAYPYLNARFNELRSVKSLLESTVSVNSISHNEEHKLLAIGRLDGTIQLLSLATKTLLPKHESIRGEVAVFSANGKYMATIGYREPLHIWSVPDLEPLSKPIVHENSVRNAICFIGDEKLACVSGVELAIYSVPDLQEIETIDIPDASLRSAELSVSPNGKFLALGTNNTVSVFDCEGLVEIASKLIEGQINSLMFLDDERLLTGGEEGVEIYLLNVHDQTLKSSGDKLDVPATCTAFRNGLIAIGTADFKVWICSGDLSRVGRLLHEDFVNAVALSANADELFAGGRDNVVRCWPQIHWWKQQATKIARHWDPAISTSDRGRIATFHDSANDGKYSAFVQVWDPAEKTQPLSISVDESIIVALAFAPNEKWLSGMTSNGFIYIWDCQTGELVQSWKSPHDWGESTGIGVNTKCHLAVSSDGSFLASCGDSPDFATWNVSDIRKTCPSAPTNEFDEEGYSSFVAFSIGNRVALVGGLPSRHGWSKIGIFSDGRLVEDNLQISNKHAEWVRQVAFSPKGDLVALQEDFSAGLIHVYAVGSGNEPLFKVQGHSSKTVALAFTPDGKQLVTGSDDRTIRFWDVFHQGELAGTLDTGERTRYIAFLPNGDMVTASREGWVRIWKVAATTPQ